jgi:AcrR family transcriptional regulator
LDHPELSRVQPPHRGTVGATFDHVAKEAGVSRGQLHNYFRSKERLLVEVVRDDCHIRLSMLEERLSKADSAAAIVDVLMTALEEALAEPEERGFGLIFELFTASRHNDDLRGEMAELYRLVRDKVASVLESKQAEGVVALRADSQAVASVLFALADGIALQVESDPGWDAGPTFAAAMQTALFLLGDG